MRKHQTINKQMDRVIKLAASAANNDKSFQARLARELKGSSK